ncbi:snurportin-1 isoform X2 [Tachysurus ichikawai]
MASCLPYSALREALYSDFHPLGEVHGHKGGRCYLRADRRIAFRNVTGAASSVLNVHNNRSVMEALTEALSSSFCVTREHNSTSAPHPRLAQYKSKYSALDQDERRRKFLKEQKE